MSSSKSFSALRIREKSCVVSRIPLYAVTRLLKFESQRSLYGIGNAIIMIIKRQEAVTTASLFMVIELAFISARQDTAIT